MRQESAPQDLIGELSMTHKISPADTDPSPMSIPGDESEALSVGGTDPGGIAALSLSAGSDDPGLVAELRGFLRKQNEVADREAEPLARTIERAGVAKQYVEAQNRHLHMQHIHDRLRLVLDAGLAAFGTVCSRAEMGAL